ncbi:MAG TPA: RNA 2',3'-cyclic phosphodiesterase [Gammaproteobacteria bacterium]|nr:RNA 2',3'-cyclic phosphodiesterase [Gammaproteobacteria bacterium]
MKAPGPPRLFVALPLPEPVTEALSGIRPSPRDGVRPIGAADMHLTLHFLGHRDVEPVRRALAAVRQPAFALRLGRPGHFSLPGRKTILWVGIEPSDALVGLHRATAEALATLGFTAETRPYRPHVTVARMASRLPETLVDTLEACLAGPESAEFECSRFALYQSETRPDGARYCVLESFPLLPRD